MRIDLNQFRYGNHERETFMRFIMALAITGALAACLTIPALAAAKHHGSASKAQDAASKTEDSSATSPYAPGQQRYRAVTHKKTKGSAAPN